MLYRETAIWVQNSQHQHFDRLVHRAHAVLSTGVTPISDSESSNKMVTFKT